MSYLLRLSYLRLTQFCFCVFGSLILLYREVMFTLLFCKEIKISCFQMLKVVLVSVFVVLQVVFGDPKCSFILCRLCYSTGK